MSATRRMKRAYSMILMSSWSNRPLDFLVGGVQKAGTSALDHYLRMHPELCLPDTKELHFFANERMAKRSKWYRHRYYHNFFVSAVKINCGAKLRLSI